MKIKKIGMTANVQKSSSARYTRSLRDWLQARGIQVLLEEEIAREIGAAGGLEIKELAANVDLIVVFGGDGTILRLAHSLCGIDVPIAGINIGRLGYLAVINLREMYNVLAAILAGNLQIEERMMLDVSILISGREEKHTVLNDVVISRGRFQRMVGVDTFIDDQYLATLEGDGIIVATPTGSTAYSLSAGGPVVYPQMSSLVITPLCPHTLTNRPLIAPAHVVVTMKVAAQAPGAVVALDGMISCDLSLGDMITVKQSPHVTRMISSPLRGYWEILRTKLGWGRLTERTTPAEPC
ncbi:MAG: NAD(+)/NADH kinase [Syntrophobacterales bacterium]|nr:NAD(+)/NADH kinase [Syntrophobacterales bacterium]